MYLSSVNGIFAECSIMLLGRFGVIGKGGPLLRNYCAGLPNLELDLKL